jgi:hypothetical protein
MESITKNWNTDLNYWDLHPINKTIKEFRDFYLADKSKDKKDSSKIMWAIAMLNDIHEDNPWRNVRLEEKLIIIKDDFINDNKFSWEDPKIVLLNDTYFKFCLSLMEQELYTYEEKLQQRSKFIKDTDYSLDYYEEDAKGKLSLKRGTADQLDKMVLNSSKLFEQILGIKDTIARQNSESKLRGGASESASEKGLL